MKICLVSDVFPPSIGGIETLSNGLAKHLSMDDRIDKVSVITFHDQLIGKEEITSKLMILRLPTKPFFKKSINLAYNLIKRRQYDVFHATTLRHSGYFVSIFNKCLARKKSFISIYGLDALSAFSGWRSRNATLITFSNMNKIITCSYSTKNKVKIKYALPDDKFRVIYPGVSTPKIELHQINRLKESYGFKNEDFVILFVGRLVKRKGADDLIRAISEVDDIDIKLLIVGDGPEKERLMQLTDKLEVSERVIFAGVVSSIFPYYPTADVFSMPSKYLEEEGDVEGLGIVFLEAQSYGLPVIGTDSGGIPETIDDGKSGFIVPEGDVKAITEKIVKLKDDRELYNKMSKNAVRFVNEKFSWKKCVDEYIKLYQD